MNPVVRGTIVGSSAQFKEGPKSVYEWRGREGKMGRGGERKKEEEEEEGCGGEGGEEKGRRRAGVEQEGQTV